MNDQVLNFLSRIQLFSSLPENELQRIAQITDIRFYPKGTSMFLQGRSKLDCIYIIQSGKIELFYEREDHKTLISALGEGEILGGISVLMNSGIAVRTAKVIKEATCCSIPVDIFLDICRRHRFFNKFFVDAFSRRMIDESYAAIFASNQALSIFIRPCSIFIPSGN